MTSKDLTLSKEEVINIIKEFGTIESEELKNPNAGMHRYTIKRENSFLYLDVWFKKSGKVKVAAVGNNSLSNQLLKIIESKSRYQDIIGTNFTAKISYEIF